MTVKNLQSAQGLFYFASFIFDVFEWSREPFLEGGAFYCGFFGQRFLHIHLQQRRTFQTPRARFLENRVRFDFPCSWPGTIDFQRRWSWPAKFNIRTDPFAKYVYIYIYISSIILLPPPHPSQRHVLGGGGEGGWGTWGWGGWVGYMEGVGVVG